MPSWAERRRRRTRPNMGRRTRSTPRKRVPRKVRKKDRKAPTLAPRNLSNNLAFSTPALEPPVEARRGFLYFESETPLNFSPSPLDITPSRNSYPFEQTKPPGKTD